MILFYYLFFSLGLFCGVGVVFSRNTVHSILFLILLFCNVVGLLFLLNVEYLAMVFIIVYIGAIAVLFLFVVMMLNLKLLDLADISWRYIPVGSLISSIFLLEIFCLYYRYNSDNIFLLSNLFEYSDSFFFNSSRSIYFQDSYVNWVNILENNDNIHVIGQVMYTYYFIAFLLSSIILLISMVGAIVLTLPDQIVYRRQHLFKQIGRKVEVSLLK